MSAAPQSPERSPSEVVAWGRWAWRRLTAMRTAIALLVLLALASIPGSVLPQRGVASDPTAVPMYYREHPDLAPWLDRLSLFNVYSAPWFAAIYVLLLISMTGCVLPRCLQLWREARSAPPPAPRRLEREAGYQAGSVADPDAALDAAAAHLRARRFRVVRVDGAVSAEKGRIRELGNLGFHLSLLLLLVGVAGGRLYGYEGRVAIVEGATFANVASGYDALTPAPLTDLSELEPLDFTLEDFSASFETAGPRLGEPRDFQAELSYRSEDAGSGTFTVRPNRPLNIDETKFFLTGHGYAPMVTVRDGNGDIATSGPVIFLPQDVAFTSDGVIKAPDARPQQLAFQGLFLPTAVEGQGGADISAYPDELNPRLQLTAYTGDLGLDSGDPQSVFALDFTDLDQVLGGDGEPWRISLAPGETAELPRGAGSVTFDGLSRFANFQVARDPGKEISLVAALLLLVGLTVSLGVSRRRVWVRRSPEDPAAIELAGRSVSRRELPADELVGLARAIGLESAYTPVDKEPVA